MRPSWPIYAAGIDAYEQGNALESTPHPENTREHYDWYHGWTDAEEASFYNGKKAQTQ